MNETLYFLRCHTHHQAYFLSDADSQLIGKDPDAGKDWGQEEKAPTEDEMVGWHHWFNGHDFEQTTGDSEGCKAWHAAVHRVAKNRTWLGNWTTTVLKVQKQSFLMWSTSGNVKFPESGAWMGGLCVQIRTIVCRGITGSKDRNTWLVNLKGILFSLTTGFRVPGRVSWVNTWPCTFHPFYVDRSDK